VQIITAAIYKHADVQDFLVRRPRGTAASKVITRAETRIYAIRPLRITSTSPSIVPSAALPNTASSAVTRLYDPSRAPTGGIGTQCGSSTGAAPIRLPRSGSGSAVRGLPSISYGGPAIGAVAAVRARSRRVRRDSSDPGRHGCAARKPANSGHYGERHAAGLRRDPPAAWPHLHH